MMVCVTIKKDLFWKIQSKEKIFKEETIELEKNHSFGNLLER
jgi:hypothetical protein